MGLVSMVERIQYFKELLNPDSRHPLSGSYWVKLKGQKCINYTLWEVRSKGAKLSQNRWSNWYGDKRVSLDHLIDPRSRVCNPYTHKRGKVLGGESLVNQVMLQIVVSEVGWWVENSFMWFKSLPLLK